MAAGRRIRLLNPQQSVLTVEAGQVVCPRRGIADVELCFLCDRFRGFQEGSPEGLMCAGESVLGILGFGSRMFAASRSVDATR